MPKYLNIDELAPEKKVLTLKGVEHEMHQVTVKEFIEITQTAAEKDSPDFKDMPVYEQVELLVKQILKAFPTVPRDQLEALPIPSLTTIIKFVSDSLEEEEAANDDGKKKPKAVK